MRFFYTDDPKGKYTGPAYEDLNANKIWSRHRYNWYVLTQMISLSDNFKEKQELREELSMREKTCMVKKASQLLYRRCFCYSFIGV